MAIAETIFFLDDKMHAWQTTVAMHSASSTAWGSMENVRDTTYVNGWKPNDGTADEYIQVDGGTQGWLGTTGGGTLYWAIAYDTRNADQTVIAIKQDGADNPAGAFGTLRASITLADEAVTVDYMTFPVSTNGKRYYRLYQLNANRGGGTRTAKILAWSMFVAAGVYKIETYQTGNTSPGQSDLMDSVGAVASPSGFLNVNALARQRQSADVHMRRINNALFEVLLGGLHITAAKAFYLQYEGLKNPIKPDFQMVRLAGSRWNATRPMTENFEVSIPIVTEAHA